MKNVFILLFLTLFSLHAMAASYTVNSAVNASTLVGVGTASDTLYIDSKVTLTANAIWNFGTVIIRVPNGEINWGSNGNNYDLTLPNCTTFDIQSGAPGLQPTGGSASKKLILGTVTIAVSNDNSSNAAFSFAEFNALGGLPKFKLSATSPLCENDLITITATPDRDAVLNPYKYFFSVLPNSGTFTSNGFTSMTSGSTQISLPAGTYTIGCRVNSTGDLLATASFNITVNSKPSLNVTASPATICSGGSSALTASGGSSYIWSPSTGLSATTGATVTANPTSTTTYTVTGTNAGGCTNTKTVTVTVNALPSVNISPTSAVICTGGNTSLNASGASTYTWSPSTGLSATTGATVTASPTSTTTYTVTGTDANGCVNTQNTTVTVNALPTATISAGGPTTFCSGGSVTLTASAGSSYLWSNGATTQSITVNSAGSYNVKVTNASGCSATSANTTVTVNTLPTATITAGGPTTFCSGSSVTLTASAGSSYLWNTGATTQSISATASGNYTVTVTNASGCSAISAAKTVTVNTSPTGIISGSQTICNGGAATLTLTVTGTGTISGTLSDGTTYSGTAPTILVNVSPTATTNYTISTMTNGTCSASSLTGSANVIYPNGTPGTWTGAADNDWFNCRNWADGKIPTTAIDVTIPATGNAPQLNSSGAVCKKLTIDGGTLSFVVSSAYLTASGDITIKNNGTLDMTSGGYLEVRGNWNNQVNTSGKGFKSGAGQVSFTSAATQTISSVNKPEVFYNISINKSSGTTDLYTDVTVTNNLGLLKGVFTTGNYLFTWNYNSAAISAPNTPWTAGNTSYSNSYICTCDGTGTPITSTGSNGFRINNVNGNTDIMFPVGADLVSANRMSLNMNGFATDNFTVVVGKGDLLNTPQSRVNRIWYVTATNGTNIKASMKLYFTKRDWTSMSFPSTQDEIETGYLFNDNHVVQKNYSGLFVNNSSPSDIISFMPYANNTEVYAQYSYNVSQDVYGSKNGINTFSRFSVVNATGIILPVSITDFKANQQGSGINVQFKALNEANIDHYEVQKSINGVTFSGLTTIPAKNNGNPVNQYAILDGKPATGNNFYRIKTIDKNNTITYTGIINLNIRAGISTIRFYPNPVVGNTLNIQLNDLVAGRYNVSLFNAAGQKVFDQIIDHTGSNATQQIKLRQGVAKGTYLVKLFNEATYITTKIIVQ